MQFELCELGIDQYPEILDLWQRAGLSIRPEGRDSLEAFARQMGWGVQRLIGLRAQGTLIAMAVLTHDGRKGWINRLAVDPTYRRQGLARMLLAESERWFTEELGLEVWAALVEGDNLASLAMFDESGYRRYDLVYASKRICPDA